ncbi:MAG: error-prone DNA polymerase [Myxococcota bacterium]|nr:error-prone DNA polymerase [Myxococcota bacterium]
MTPAPDDYIELRARSAFSFLEGASNPEALIERAEALGYPALALADRGGVYGAPRFHQAARRAGLRPILGAEIDLDTGDKDPRARLLLLVESARGWRGLSRLLTLGHRGRDKAECRVDWNQVEEHAQGLTLLLRGDEHLTPGTLDRALGIFGQGMDRIWVDVSRHLDRTEEARAQRAVAMAEACRVPVLASGDVRCARPRDRTLLDALTCLRWKTTLDRAGRRLLANGERSLHTRKEIVRRFADRPQWITATRTVAERCSFDLDDLEYHFPEYPLPAGESQAGHLRALTLRGAGQRYGNPLPPRARSQIEHELALIAKLELDGYFLIVHDIVDFARREGILCQGRGSAANSAVCYALGITAVDPVGMELLFERFLSEERGEWPDIDLDLPSGERRERVIQHVFAKYGPQGAAMTANVITYRTRLAVREMGKVVGLAPESVDRLARKLSRLDLGDSQAPDILTARMGEAGLDPTAPRVAHLIELVNDIQGLPRHLGQHSGGIVVAAGRLDEVVPIEPARMAGRHIIQWDKEDCSDLGIIKIDLLGLGMLAALEETLPLIERHEGKKLDLAHLPPDDPETYAMLCRADTVGVFQVESRAQMATLPRMKPRSFYDLVVEIAIIRPGPIVGQMVHPYLNRRAGREPVRYPHPCLEPILKRTLGIPIFQEQLLRVAMTAAGFSGGEAEELRRAMGFKRSTQRMHSIEERLRTGMARNGIPPDAQEEIVQQVTAFALYGFPESHSASFALIAYASAYLKCHHPAAFLVGLLNAWPMGFYSPATLIKDAQRHGVDVRAIDVTQSRWRCGLQPGATPASPPAVRLGLCFARGLREVTGNWLEAEREEAPFRSLADLVKRVPFNAGELDVLAELGALAEFETTPRERRAALWQVAGIERDRHSLFAGREARESEAPDLTALSALEETLADYRLSGLTPGPQIMAHLRPGLAARGVLTAAALTATPNGTPVHTAGHVIVRQRPASAGGLLFLTLEDETGLSNALVTPDQAERFRVPLNAASLVEIRGPLQNVDGVVHVKLRHLAPLDPREGVHDPAPTATAPLPEAHDYR